MSRIVILVDDGEVVNVISDKEELQVLVKYFSTTGKRLPSIPGKVSVESKDISGVEKWIPDMLVSWNNEQCVDNAWKDASL